MTQQTVAEQELAAPQGTAQPPHAAEDPSQAIVHKRWIARRWMQTAQASAQMHRRTGLARLFASRRRIGLALASLVVAGATLLVPTAGMAPSTAQATSRMQWTAGTTGARAVELAGQRLIEALPPGPDGAQGAEHRLIDAYRALADGRPDDALKISRALVQAQPGFALGQLLYADLLATRAGVPSFLGAVVSAETQTGRETPAVPAGGASDLGVLRDESNRRLAALLERPPAGAVPSEFLALPETTRYAVAVDASRSRLYLFANGPDGLRLERDFYVSLGKLGIDKKANGDLRTPIGVYWITSALTAQQIAPQFGRAALGINYPNAWDRQQGRHGRGLFVHGVPEALVARQPFATDGCVALANDDMQYLESRLTAVDTPVVISRQLQWVSRSSTEQAAADFRQAYDAWEQARLGGSEAARQAWNDDGARLEEPVARSKAPRRGLSLISWNGDGTPLMVVTSRQAPDEEAGLPAMTVRQYWAQRQGRWRVVFEGKVPGPEATPARPVADLRAAG